MEISHLICPKILLYILWSVMNVQRFSWSKVHCSHIRKKCIEEFCQNPTISKNLLFQFDNTNININLLSLGKPTNAMYVLKLSRVAIIWKNTSKWSTKTTLRNNATSVIVPSVLHMLWKLTSITCTNVVNVKSVDRAYATLSGSKDIWAPHMELCLKILFSAVIVLCFSQMKALKIIMSKNNMPIFSKSKIVLSLPLFIGRSYAASTQYCFQIKNWPIKLLVS